MLDNWVVFNIPCDLQEIEEGKAPPGGVEGKNTSGRIGYFGPCPPDREHRYFFKLYALDTFLTLKKGATKTEVEEAMKEHIVAECQLMGRFEKGKCD